MVIRVQIFQFVQNGIGFLYFPVRWNWGVAANWGNPSVCWRTIFQQQRVQVKQQFLIRYHYPSF